MKVVLVTKIKNLGNIGDIVDVKSGFARNFLLPYHKALPATEKYIKDFFFINDGDFQTIRIFLKYDFNGLSVIENIKRCSRPGQRIYVGSQEIPRVLDGLGISILSTSKGVISNKTASRLKVGGELLCEVF